MKKIIILLSIILANISEMQASVITGTCGSNLTWSLNTKDSTLSIEGSGYMTTYKNSSNQRAPWYEYRSYIAYIHLPDGLRNISNYAFFECTNLTFINLPSNITEIGKQAFEWCGSMQHINIPNNVSKIGYCAFSNCKELRSIIIPNSVTIIDESAFVSCLNLTSVVLSNSITKIEYATFANCINLTSIEIPNSISYIGKEAFRGCSRLDTVILGNQVRNIAQEAFSNCRNIQYITSKAIIPPTCASDPFLYVNIGSVKLYVPEESVEAYSNALWWEDFIILPIGAEQEAIENIKVEKETTKLLNDGQIYILRGDKTYTLQGQEVK